MSSNRRPDMRTAIKAGGCYFLLGFGIGFLFGVVRVLVLVPQMGETWAVLVEVLPLLALLWFACARVTGRFSVPNRPMPRLLMGGVALSLLWLAEIPLAVIGFDMSLAEHLATFQEPAKQLGGLGQVVFALFPLLQMRRSCSVRPDP